MMVIQILFERGRVFRERAGPPSHGTPSTLASGESPSTPAGQVGLPSTKITRTEPIHQIFIYYYSYTTTGKRFYEKLLLTGEIYDYK
jgi:hypothetical protein